MSLTTRVIPILSSQHPFDATLPPMHARWRVELSAKITKVLESQRPDVVVHFQLPQTMLNVVGVVWGDGWLDMGW